MMNKKLWISCIALLSMSYGCSGDVIGNGTVCQTHDDCSAPYFCVDGLCLELSGEGETCVDSDDCIQGHICQNDRCVKKEQESTDCDENMPCKDGICIEGKCESHRSLGEDCQKDTECEKGLVCIDDRCMKGVEINEACSAPYHFCLEGSCENGFCNVPSGVADTDGDTIADTYDRCNTDTDGDTLMDCQDLDSDADTIPDAVEAGNDGNPKVEPLDSDGDLIYDFLSPDADGNGIPDLYEGCPNPDFPYIGSESLVPTAVCDHPVDSDGDTVPDTIDLDNDGDSAMDILEIYGITTMVQPYVPGRKCGDAPCAAGTPEAPWDSDGDTIFDYNDPDSDNDTIPDRLEGIIDSNRDGELDRYSLDSDGDTIPDAQEIDAEGLPLSYEMTDGTILYCYRSSDCDLDSLSDPQEPVCDGISGIHHPDTDGDGFMDASEIAAGIYANEHGLLDGSSVSDVNSIVCDPNLGVTDVFDFYFELPWEGPKASDLLEFIPKVSKLDLVFNVDTTGSMTQAIQNVKSNISGIISQVQGMVPDSGFALVNFDDFPTGVGYIGYLTSGEDVVYPYGDAYSGDLPFRVLGKISTNQATVQGYTKNTLFNTRNGADDAESGAESLYHILTGEGTSWYAGNYTGYILNSSTTAYHGTISWSAGSIANNINAPNTWGGVDFRTGSLPVVVHTTDIYSHDAPSIYNNTVLTQFSYNQYVTSIPNPHYTADIVPKFKEKGLRVITLGVPIQSGAEIHADDMNQMTTWARESNAIVPACAFENACGTNNCCLGSRTIPAETINGRENQCILYYTSEQTDVSTYITKGVDALVKYGTYDVATQLIGEPIPGSSVDTSCFIKQVVATAYVPPPAEPEKSCNPVAIPTSVNGADYLNGFENFAPGTSNPNREGAKLHFTVYAQNDNCVPATEEAQIFRAYINVINPTTGLVFDRRQVSIIVPGELNHNQIN